MVQRVPKTIDSNRICKYVEPNADVVLVEEELFLLDTTRPLHLGVFSVGVRVFAEHRETTYKLHGIGTPKLSLPVVYLYKGIKFWFDITVDTCNWNYDANSFRTISHNYIHSTNTYHSDDSINAAIYLRVF